MEYITVIVSTSFGFVLGLLTLWGRNKLSEKALSKIDSKKVRKVIIKNDEIILEAEGGRTKTLKKEKEVAEKKLEAKIKEIGCLERDFECVWELLKKAIETAKKSSDTTNNFVEIANEFKKLSKENFESWKEAWNLYLEVKDKHEKYNKEMVEMLADLFEVYREMACEKCWIKLEFLLKNGWKRFKVKKLN